MINKTDAYILEHLRQVGLSGQPLSNVFAVLPFERQETYESLRQLTDNGLVKLVLSADGLLDGYDLTSLDNLDPYSLKPDAFMTNACITLRGLFKAGWSKDAAPRRWSVLGECAKKIPDCVERTLYHVGRNIAYTRSPER